MKKSKSKNNIGRLFLRGEIKVYLPAHTPLGRREYITPKGVEDLIEDALKQHVKGLIFEIDSPGGGIVPSKEIADYIKKIEVPTVALVKGYAASGAYWIATACDKIVANEYSFVGSIGVLLPHVEISKLANKYGIRYDGIKSGEYKDMGNIFRRFTDEERAILQEELNAIHEGFIESIAENRGLDIKQIREYAKGLTYHGVKAKELGLVDEIGNTDKAIEIIERKGDFKHAKVVDYEPKIKKLKLRIGIGSAAYNIGRNIARGIIEQLQSYNQTHIR